MKKKMEVVDGFGGHTSPIYSSNYDNYYDGDGMFAVHIKSLKLLFVVAFTFVVYLVFALVIIAIRFS